MNSMDILAKERFLYIKIVSDSVRMYSRDIFANSSQSLFPLFTYGCTGTIFQTNW